MSSANISVRTTPITDDSAYAVVQLDETQFPPRTFNGKIERNWWISSYSSLSRFHTVSHQSAPIKQEISEAEIEIIPKPSPFSFPRGARHGSFLHLLFELIDFQNNDRLQMSAIIEEQLTKHLYNDVVLWTPILTNWFEQILTFPLSQSLSLSTLMPSSKKVEMQFFIDMKPLQGYQVNKLLKQYDPLSARAGEFQFQTVQGYLKGFIDLTFEHDGKYYVLDYKSNHLGNELSDYNQANIENMMIEHRYDFQYQLYTLALHRLLRSRLPDYDYEKHIGGVYYTFIRGMQDNADCGVYFNKPDFLLIDGLDKLFNGETL